MFKIESAKKIMIIDDNLEIQELLTYTLSREEGYEIECYSNPEIAIKDIPKFAPNLILLDNVFPGAISGLETLEKIKNLPEPYCDTPVVFITNSNKVEFITQAFNMGAMDFIAKPIYPKEVLSRVKLHLKVCSLINSQKKLLQELEHTNKLLLDEQLVAKEIFDNLVDKGCLQHDFFKSWISSASIFNGDMLLSYLSSKKQLYIMLGDFTGHGLPAAIGVIPASETFYSMCKQNLQLSQIIREINKKLNENLPHGVFCASACYHIDFTSGNVEFFNASIPGTLFVDANYKVHNIKSQNLPLGVLSDKSFNPHIETFKMQPSERLYLFTDGIAEIQNSVGEFFGKDKIHNILSENTAGDAFQSIIQSIDFFAGGVQDDDITLLEFTYPAIDQLSSILDKKAS